MTSATARPPRTAATPGGSNLRLETYTANDLNQYTQRTVPSFSEVQGRARSDATVTVNLPPRRGAHPPSGVVVRALAENPCGTGGSVVSADRPRATVLDAGAHPATPEGGCAPRTVGRELMIDNSASPLWLGVTNVAVLRGAGAGGTDLVASNTGTLFLPQTPETYVHPKSPRKELRNEF